MLGLTLFCLICFKNYKMENKLSSIAAEIDEHIYQISHEILMPTVFECISREHMGIEFFCPDTGLNFWIKPVTIKGTLYMRRVLGKGWHDDFDSHKMSHLKFQLFMAQLNILCSVRGSRLFSLFQSYYNTFKCKRGHAWIDKKKVA